MRQADRWGCSIVCLAAAVALGGAVAAAAADTPDEHANHSAHAHDAHLAASAIAHGPGYARITQAYRAPAVPLVRADGTRVDFAADLDDGRPVVLSFIYTTCTTVCPVQTQVLERLQARLGAERDRVLLASVSIDPEHDTPSRLAAYAQSHGAGPQWRFYTGSEEASVSVQKAFGVYNGDKMSHVPVTFLRAAPGQPWLRLEGFVTPDELAQELQKLRAAG
jgi:protein SCO1/2